MQSGNSDFKKHKRQSNLVEALETRLMMAKVPFPSTPQDFRAAALGTSTVRLNWSDSSNETSYVVERYTGSTYVSQSGSLSANVTQYDANSLNSGTQYQFRVRAVNSRGSRASSAATATTASPTPTIAAPVLMNDSALPMTHRINLHWGNVTNASKWIVQRQSGGTWQEVFNGTMPYNANGYNFVDTGLAEKTSYSYRAFAVASDGTQSAASNTLTTSTGAVRVLHSSTASGPLPDLGIIETNVRDATYFLFQPYNGPVDPVRAAQTARYAMNPDGTPGWLIIDVESWDNSAASIQYFKDLITVIRTAAPTLYVGTFAPTYIDFHPTINGQRMRGLDFAAPNLYSTDDNILTWWQTAEQTVADENLAGVPVYPFLWPRYNSIAFMGAPVLEPEFWEAQQAATSQLADGFVIWGDDPAIRPTTTFSPAWWTKTQQFMQDLAVTNPAAPAAPLNVSVNSSDSRINWVDASTNEAVFLIDRAELVNGVWSAYDMVGVVGSTSSTGTARTYTDSRLSSGKTYRYRVGALSNRGKVTWVETAGQGTSGRSGFERIQGEFYDRASSNTWRTKGEAVTQSTLNVWYEFDNVDFNDAAGNPAKHVVLRQSSQFDAPVTIELLVDATVGASGQPVGGTVIGQFGAIRTTDNTYLIEQRNAITSPTPINGRNVHNLFVRFTSPTGQWTVNRLDWLRFDNGAVAAPTFSSSARTANSITLNWSNVSAAAMHHDNHHAAGYTVAGDIDGYDIYYSTSADFAVSTLAYISAQPSATSATISGLLANTRYYFRLVANDTYRTPKTSLGFRPGYGWNVATTSALTA